MTSRSSFISCFQLTVALGPAREPLFHQVSFDLEEGIWAEFVGPTASGKSLLFGILSLRMAMPQGKLLVAGRNVDRLGSRPLAMLRRQIGSCEQNVRLLEERTVAENLVLPLVVREKTEGAARQAEAILEALGIAELRDVCACRLSLHERRLVGMARALIGQPQMVVLDGGLGGLEREGAERVLDLLLERHSRGTTVLLFSRTPQARQPDHAQHWRVGQGAVELWADGPRLREVV